MKNELFEGYVDDTTDVLVAVDPGVKYDGEKLVINEDKVDEDKDIPEDKRTMEILKDIGNTIFQCVQFTVDCPSNYPNGKVPVLDLQVYTKNNKVAVL